MAGNNGNRRRTQCSKCGKWIAIYTTTVFNRTTGKESLLYNASCPRCRHTIYADTLEEMMR